VIERFLADVRGTTWPELLAVALGLAYAVLAVRRDRRCWLFGGCSSAILAGLAWQAALPMQGLLQAAYVALSGYGYVSWTRERGAPGGVSVRRWSMRRNAVVLASIVALGLATAPAVGEWTAAAWPRLDTLTMLASLVATWMVARALIENWLYWIVIDAVCVFLYGAQGLAFVALLYALYFAIAMVGFWAWGGAQH
jgi:nicotinamide mononucleotide transporter